MINWMRYRFLYLAISLVTIGAGIFGLLKWGLNFGVDFRGGSIGEFQFEKNLETDKALVKIADQKISVSSLQKVKENTYLFKLPPTSPADKEKLIEVLAESSGGKVEELRFETVGPTIGPELIKKTVYAMLAAALTILFWVAYQFKSLKFGASAVLAMFHDSLVVIGLYSLLGHFFGAEVDFLFVTGLLTILSFSVHDTIVVYDRIRESQKKTGGEISEIADRAISETMVRSLNNSFTIIFMLVALLLLGGTTIKWFAATLLIGTISGTYSSPFVAVPILVSWDEIAKKVKGRS